MKKGGAGGDKSPAFFMGRPIKDLSGMRFHRLVAVEPVGRNANGNVRWRCVCDCGTETVVNGGNLTSSAVQSCGCLSVDFCKSRFTTHGGKGTAEYRVWVHLKRRCESERDKSFPRYGGRNIECRFESFDAFIGCIGRRPTPRHQIDRINNDGHYEPGNVRWALPVVNTRNRQSTIFIAYMGVDRPLGEWAEILGVRWTTLYARHKRGWPPEEILFGRQR